MRWVYLLFIFPGCISHPEPKTPVVFIPSVEQNYAIPKWEEPVEKRTAERSAKEIQEFSYSVMDYVQLKWRLP